MNGELTFKSGVKDVVPTLVGYIGVGIAFGIVGKTSNLSVIAVFLMSLIVYGGSAQFMIAGMLLSGSTIASIVISTILIQARMSLMSMTVAPYLKRESMAKNIWTATLVTDETFALSMNKLNYTDHTLNFSWFNSANIMAYLVWSFSTAVGAILGSAIKNPATFGLDFAIVAMFLGLLYLQIITDNSKPFGLFIAVAVFSFACVYILMRFMPGSSTILFATILSAIFGMVVEGKPKKKRVAKANE